MLRKDYAGKRFGKLTAIASTGKRKRRNVIWKFRCDCGREIERTIMSVMSSVDNGSMPSCGYRGCRNNQLGSNKVDISGQKFGKLTAISPTDRRNKKLNVIWIFRCDCGKFVEKDASDVIAITKFGSSPSCRDKQCLGYKRLPAGLAAQRRTILSYKRHARDRNLSFELTEIELNNLFQGKCFYCGSEPINVAKPTESTNGNFVYNGIDRLDSKKGYGTDNVVSCCYICNRAKSNMSTEHFIQWIKNVYSNILREELWTV